MAAVAVARAVERVSGAQVGIKWTNDLVLGGKKLCGILTEMALEGETGAVQSLVIGAGGQRQPPPGGLLPRRGGDGRLPGHGGL